MGYLGLVFCEAPAAAQRQEGWAASVYLQLRKLVLALTQGLKQTKQQWYRGKAEVLMTGNAGEKKGAVAECESRKSWRQRGYPVHAGMTGKEGELSTFSKAE